MSQGFDSKKSLYQKFTDVMPSGAGALFFIQIFATLSFSVLYSSLVLYATNKLKLNDLTATSITASFVAFNYFLHLLGGYIGGRYLTYRTLFSIAMIAQIIGCVLISFPSDFSLYWGLAAFLTGSGLNVTCINCLLTQLFKPDDKKREAAFLWNYSGMNIGFFIGFSLSGYLHLRGAYQELFLISSLGNVIALLIAVFKWNALRDISTRIIQLHSAERWLENFKGCALIIALVLALSWLLRHAQFSNSLIMVTGVIMLFVISYLALIQPHEQERKKIWAYLILAMTSLVFWTLYQIAPMGLTLFIERNVDRHYFGMIVAPQWVQNINTVVIIFGGPIMSVVFTSLRKKGIQFSIPFQFSCALILIGIGFAILPLGIHFANSAGLINFSWIIASFILLSLGELFISPIGYAMVGQLAPIHLQGVMMGTWLMLIGVAATLSDYFSTMALGIIKTTNPLITNSSFSHTFGMLGWISIMTGLILLLAVPLVLRLTQEKIMVEPINPEVVLTN